VTGSAKTKHNSVIHIFQILGILKKICQHFYMPCSWWRKCQRLKPGYHLICPSKRSSKIFVWSQYTKGIVSYGCLFTWHQSGWSRSIFLHGFWHCLWWYKGVKGIINQAIYSSVYGKHSGANFESVLHSIRKLHPF